MGRHRVECAGRDACVEDCRCYCHQAARELELEALARQGGECARCHRTIHPDTRTRAWQLATDQLVPPWHGGRVEPANKVAVHRHCRRDRTPWETRGLAPWTWAHTLERPTITVRRVA